MIAFSTKHLILRRWRASDRQPFARLNADLRVMEYFPHPLTREASNELADKIEAHFEKYGFGAWAAELLTTGQFIGFIGLNVPTFEAHFTRPEFPAVEIGWRLAHEYWGRGLATEGARAVLRYAFMKLQLPEVVSFTTVGNHRSRRVMKKLGMTHNPEDDFDHPDLAEGDPLRRHVLYRKVAYSFDWAEVNKPAASGD